jgi:hypothetical protein
MMSRPTHLPVTTVYGRRSEKLGFNAWSQIGATYPVGRSEGNTGPGFNVPTYDTGGIRIQRLTRHRDPGGI